MVKKYAIIVNNETKAVDVALGEDTKYYESIGMTLMNVEESYNGNWYVEGYAPAKPEPALQQVLTELEQKYNMPRVIREGILGNPSMYSQFNVLRARELEEIAEKIRQLKEGK